MRKRVYAVMPVKGREELLLHTIERLSKQTYPTMAICCGHNESEREVCEKAGAIFIQCPDDTHLGDKWNRCIKAAEERKDAEAVMILGSSDWIEDTWVERMMNEPYGAVGTAGIYFLDIQRSNYMAMYYWPGYKGSRIGESIGAGRIIKKKVLDKVKWNLFYPDWDVSLDFSTTKILNEVNERIVCVDNPPVGLSISTYKWTNKHNFRTLMRKDGLHRYKESRIKEFLEEYFPEAINIFNKNK